MNRIKLTLGFGILAVAGASLLYATLGVALFLVNLVA